MRQEASNNNGFCCGQSMQGDWEEGKQARMRKTEIASNHSNTSTTFYSLVCSRKINLIFYVLLHFLDEKDLGEAHSRRIFKRRLFGENYIYNEALCLWFLLCISRVWFFIYREEKICNLWWLLLKIRINESNT